MSPQHIRINTRTGFMSAMLNDGKLLVIFRVDENSPSLRSIHIEVQNPRAVYDGGWRLSVLQWLVDNYEPAARSLYELPC